MDIWKKYKSPLGYETGDNKVDTFGVDHSQFSLRDEIEYQTARAERENQLIQNYNNQGITENYPQVGTNFCGSPENNYGFGSSNISKNINNVMNSFNSSGFNEQMARINALDQSSDYSGISNPTAQQISYGQQLTDALHPQSYFNEQQVFTTDYVNNYPNFSDLGKYNQIFRNYLYPQPNSNYISDEDLYARMWNNIKEQEGVKLHPYLDTKGLITIGGGANVDDWNVFNQLNATVNGIPASEAQRREAYNRMRQLSDEKDTEGNFINRNMKAKFFENKTDIRISDAEARGLAQNHMTNDLTHLRSEFSDFDNFPLPLKEVLLDIQYNVRGGVNQNDWPNLYQAIRNRDVNGIVDNVNRKDVQQSRNDWAKRTARSIQF